MHTELMPPTKKAAKKYPRTNIYLRNPILFQALQVAVTNGFLEARSASERIEQLLRSEAKRVLPKFKTAGLPMAKELQEFLQD